MYFDCILFLLPTPVRLFLLPYLLNFMSFPLPSKNTYMKKTTKKKIKTNKETKSSNKTKNTQTEQKAYKKYRIFFVFASNFWTWDLS